MRNLENEAIVLKTLFIRWLEQKTGRFSEKMNGPAAHRQGIQKQSQTKPMGLSQFK
jgi:hypothetical protein